MNDISKYVQFSPWFKVSEYGRPVNPGRYQWKGFDDKKIRFGEIIDGYLYDDDGVEYWILSTDEWRGIEAV